MTCSARSFSSARRSSDEAPVLGVVGAAPARAGDRAASRRVLALHGDQRLGAGAAEGEVVEGDVVHVRARVHGAQAAVDGERRHVDGRAEALAEHDLEGVAGVDVLADALDAGLVLRRASSRRSTGRGRRAGRAPPPRAASARPLPAAPAAAARSRSLARRRCAPRRARRARPRRGPRRRRWRPP